MCLCMYVYRIEWIWLKVFSAMENFIASMKWIHDSSALAQQTPFVTSGESMRVQVNNFAVKEMGMAEDDRSHNIE